MSFLSQAIKTRIAIATGLFAVLLGLLWNFHSSSAPWESWLGALSALLLYAGGAFIYLSYSPQVGLIPLLIFHFFAAVFWIARFAPQPDGLSAVVAMLALALLPALLLDFSISISQAFPDSRKKNLVAWLTAAAGILLAILGSALLDVAKWDRLRYIFAFALIGAYGSWLWRLWQIIEHPRVEIDRQQASQLLRTQLLGVTAPMGVFILVMILAGRPLLPWLAPLSLLLPVSLGISLARIKARQREIYIVQSEKRQSFGNLLAGLTHEINNPLNFIYSNMEPMQEMLQKLKTKLAPSDLDGHRILEDLQKMGESMETGVQTIRGLVEQFRGFPKPRPEEKDQVDLNQVLERSIELLGHKWKEKIELQRHFGEVRSVRGFPAELGQVFTNIVANACDATPPGGTVEVRTQNAVGGVNVFVRDSGAGIAKENISRVFDPFFTTKSQGEGTGLGLSIAQQIIKSHKGSIEVQSNPGRGTEFVVFLPH